MAERRFYQGETFANYDPGELLENAEFEDCVFDTNKFDFIDIFEKALVMK